MDFLSTGIISNKLHMFNIETYEKLDQLEFEDSAVLCQKGAKIKQLVWGNMKYITYLCACDDKGFITIFDVRTGR